MRRRAVSQRIQEKAEASAKLLFTQAERFEQPLLNVLPVNPDAARAKFVAIQHQVVTLRTHFPRRGFQLLQILVDDAGERMLRADPGFFRLAPLKKRKARNPQEFPLRLVNQAKRFAELQAQLPRN